MRVLVTGLDGFTGHYVADALKEGGHDVVGLGDADLTDVAAIDAAVAAAKPEAVIHLAGIAFVHSPNVARFYEVNQVGTFGLLDAVARHSPNATVVIASSANIYGAQQSASLAETTAPNPLNHYALSKYAMELGTRFWADRLNIVIVRPFNYTGRGQDKLFLVPKIVDHFMRREARIELGNIDVARDFSDVRDVAAVYRAMIENVPAERVINISTGVGHTVRQILAAATAITGHAIEAVVNPEFVRPNEIDFLVGDNRRLRASMPDWQPIAFEETLRWMLTAN